MSWNYVTAGRSREGLLWGCVVMEWHEGSWGLEVIAITVRVYVMSWMT